MWENRGPVRYTRPHFWVDSPAQTLAPDISQEQLLLCWAPGLDGLNLAEDTGLPRSWLWGTILKLCQLPVAQAWSSMFPKCYFTAVILFHPRRDYGKQAGGCFHLDSLRAA